MNGLQYKIKQNKHKNKNKIHFKYTRFILTFANMKRYDSKTDKGFVWFPSLILTAVALLLIIEKAWLGLPIVFLTALYIVDILRNTNYSVDGKNLTVVSGRFHKIEFPISSIYKIKPSRDPSKAPANSMDRIAISYTIESKKKEVLVSPENKEEFIQALKDINENIEFGRLYKI